MLKKTFVFVLFLFTNIAYTQQTSPLEGIWVNQKMQSTTITFSGNKFMEETRLSDTFGLRGTYSYTEKTITINLSEENNGDGWKTKRPPVTVTYSYNLSGITLSISGYSSGETQIYRKQSSTTGGSALDYNRSGLEYFGKKDYNRAITEFSQAIRLNSNYAEAYNNRGNAYSAKGDYNLAIADFTQAIRLEPNNAEAYSNRGEAYSGKEDYVRAIADLDQAIRLDPNNAQAYSRRALAYWGKGERSISNPKVLISNPNTGKTDYDRAIADYTQVIRLLPNNAKAYDDRGCVYAQRGNIYRDKSDYDRAIADFENALRLDPKIDKFSLELTKKWRDTDTFRTP